MLEAPGGPVKGSRFDAPGFLSDANSWILQGNPGGIGNPVHRIRQYLFPF